MYGLKIQRNKFNNKQENVLGYYMQTESIGDTYIEEMGQVWTKNK